MARGTEAEIKALIDAWNKDRGDIGVFLNKLSELLDVDIETLTAPGGFWDQFIQNGVIQSLGPENQPVVDRPSSTLPVGANLDTGASLRAQVNPEVGPISDPFQRSINQGFLNVEGTATREGRNRVFNNFIANKFRNFSPAQQRVLERQQGPLDATFTLGGFEGNFRDFLGTNPRSFSAEQFGSSIDDLSRIFSAEGIRGAPDQALFDKAIAANPAALISEVLSSQVSPSQRNFIPDIVNRRFSRARDVDPTITNETLLRRFFEDRELRTF